MSLMQSSFIRLSTLHFIGNKCFPNVLYPFNYSLTYIAVFPEVSFPCYPTLLLPFPMFTFQEVHLGRARSRSVQRQSLKRKREESRASQSRESRRDASAHRSASKTPRDKSGMRDEKVRGTLHLDELMCFSLDRALRAGLMLNYCSKPTNL